MAIDGQALDKLREIVGGEESDLIELIDAFLEEAPDIVAALVAAHGASDLVAARRAAHSLKSNARDMGARELAEICMRLEALCAAGVLPDAAEVEAARLAFAVTAGDLRDAYPAASQ